MDYRNFKTLEEFETYFNPYIKKIDENKELILDIVNKKQDVGQNIYSNRLVYKILSAQKHSPIVFLNIIIVRYFQLQVLCGC